MILPIVARHGKGANRILDPARVANAIVERAVLRDHLLHLCRIVRRWNANEIEREDHTFVRQPNQWGAKRSCEHGIIGNPSEWPDMLAGQSVEDLAGDPFSAGTA